MDLPLVGETFTWSNNWDFPSWSRVNRFLIFWNGKLSFFIYLRKGCIYCDQTTFPFSFDCGGIKWGKRSFKFENIWVKAEGFVGSVR
jgi:hypothetical protein